MEKAMQTKRNKVKFQVGKKYYVRYNGYLSESKAIGCKGIQLITRPYGKRSSLIFTIFDKGLEKAVNKVNEIKQVCWNIRLNKHDQSEYLDSSLIEESDNVEYVNIMIGDKEYVCSANDVMR